jgi:TPR repeat protein
MPAVVASGSINASSLPRGASLRVDGKATSRRRLNVPSGRHILAVSLDGYTSRTDTLTVVTGQTLRWAPRLEPVHPVRTVATRPAPVEPPAAPPARRGNPDEAGCRQAMASSGWRDAYAACGRAAQTGSAPAQRSIAVLFQNGHGVRRSDDSAARWFAQAAHGGDTESEYQLAIAYEHGRGVPRNQGAALDWYTRAATAGLAAAQFIVGEAYEKGHLGASKDKGKALEWYRKAAAQGNKDAANKVRDLER